MQINKLPLSNYVNHLISHSDHFYKLYLLKFNKTNAFKIFYFIFNTQYLFRKHINHLFVY